jgi:hypothetical protein
VLPESNFRESCGAHQDNPFQRFCFYPREHQYLRRADITGSIILYATHCIDFDQSINQRARLPRNSPHSSSNWGTTAATDRKATMTCGVLPRAFTTARRKRGRRARREDLWLRRQRVRRLHPDRPRRSPVQPRKPIAMNSRYPVSDRSLRNVRPCWIREGRSWCMWDSAAARQIASALNAAWVHLPERTTRSLSRLDLRRYDR